MQKKPPAKNARTIHTMFSAVAHRYDVANTILSGGVHYIWRRQIVRWSGARKGQRVLDCATGTGDLAIVYKKAVGKSGEVIATDYCEPMIEKGPQKAARHGVAIDFEVADAMKLPYKAGSFDITSMAFGIRNVADAHVALKQMGRVTKAGGKVMILEFGQPSQPIVNAAYSLYAQKILPIIGGLITGQPKAYRYLQSSSKTFPCGEDFTKFMMKSGMFSQVEYRRLSFGIAYMYKAIVKK